ncbi:MAG: translation initiation factor IF-2 associated domain-containing protein, partial [Burkholderiaceae bacterium]|nr:translation initiation factor IF-2 associated domain-containing protein [Burkholderiaceae bacterium]
MSSTTVAQFASELKKSTDTLLEQLRAAGLSKLSASDVLTEGDKQTLLGHLQAAHGTSSPERKKITLVKKSTSEIKQADGQGRARTIQVEVRKKRTFVKRDDGTEAGVEEDASSAASALHEADLARREEEARQQAEQIQRQEEELAEQRRQREAQEERERVAAEAAEAAEKAEKAERARAAAKAAEEAARNTPPPAAVAPAAPVVEPKA